MTRALHELKYFAWAAVILWTGNSSALLAQRKIAEGKITYISGESYYTDIGKDVGAAKGDTVYMKIRRSPILIIQSISRKSSFCTKISPSLKIDFGTEIFVFVAPSVSRAAVDTVHVRDTIPSGKEDLKSLWQGAGGKSAGDSAVVAPARHRTAAQGANQVSGRIALQNYISRDRISPDFNYQQPGGLVNVGIDRIGGSHYNFNTNIRFRKTLSKKSTPADNYPVRIYELNLEYFDPATPYQYAAGRIFAPVINGVGNFDGVLFSYKFSQRWEAGAFGGTQPDNLNSTPQWKDSKVGVYANFRNEPASAYHWNSTLAFSGQYVKSKIDREYFYVQNDVAFGPNVYFYQNSEIGINRSALSRRKHKLEVSNFYVLGHYNPAATVTLSASYDARVNVFLLQTYRLTPDSLFDDALLQGFRGDVSWRATRHLTLSGSSSIRSRTGDTRKTYLNSAGGYYYNLLGSQLNLNTFYFHTSTPATKAHSLSFGVARQFSDLYVSAAWRAYAYVFTNLNSTDHRNSLTLDGNLALSRKLFASFEYEYSTGPYEKADRIFTELSYRF